MYENQTYEKIRDRMLGSMPADIDKREGSIAFDAAAPAAIELMYLYIALDLFIKNTFGDTATRPFLIERARERGLTPQEATPSVVRLIPTPSDAEISTGARFSCDDVNFRITGKATTGSGYLAECETAGTIGNKPNGPVVPIDYVAGLSKVEIAEIVTAGEDEEETETFRKRYLASFDSMAFGGNIQDYKEKVGAIAGVGGVKVYPVWNGGGTVKVVFSTSDNKPPAAEKVAEVQTAIDPVTNAGKGIGIAPIGHRVTVAGASWKDVSISMKVTVSSGAPADYADAIKKAIQKYFDELNASWEETEVAKDSEYSNTGVTVRIAQIEYRVMNISGIIDAENITINGSAANFTAGNDELVRISEIGEAT